MHSMYVCVCLSVCSCVSRCVCVTMFMGVTTCVDMCNGVHGYMCGCHCVCMCVRVRGGYGTQPADLATAVRRGDSRVAHVCVSVYVCVWCTCRL